MIRRGGGHIRISRKEEEKGRLHVRLEEINLLVGRSQGDRAGRSKHELNVQAPAQSLKPTMTGNFIGETRGGDQPEGFI